MPSKRKTSKRKSKRSKKSRSKKSKKSKSRSNQKYNITLKKSSKSDKKYMVIINLSKSNSKKTKKTIHFGAKDYSDYTKHKDPERKQRYITRHKKTENWKKSGIESAGFWSRWILWNKPTFKGSITDTEKRFNIKIRS